MQTDSMTERLSAAVIGIASTGVTVTRITITHEAFASVKAEAGELVDIRNKTYHFGGIPVTTVAELPDDALNPHYVVDWESTDQ